MLVMPSPGDQRTFVGEVLISVTIRHFPILKIPRQLTTERLPSARKAPMDADAQTQPTLPDSDGPSRRRRVRDFRRGYQACELCRKKKIRCIVDKPGVPCLRCQREVKECVFSDERSHRKRNKTLSKRASSKEGVYLCWASDPITLCNPFC
jgi:hypothetical protein